jgi:DNA-binding YbaB/EbfC family protein
MQQLLAAAAAMQSQLMNAQQELADAEVLGTAGGGLVTVTVNGQGELVDVTISADAVDPADPEESAQSIADLVLAAYRAACGAAGSAAAACRACPTFPVSRACPASAARRTAAPRTAAPRKATPGRSRPGTPGRRPRLTGTRTPACTKASFRI